MNHRVQFDFEIDFSNGGGIQGRDFRLDIAGDDISIASWPTVSLPTCAC